MDARDPAPHVDRAFELALRALEAFGPAPTLLELVRELATARYLAGRAPVGAVLTDYAELIAGRRLELVESQEG